MPLMTIADNISFFVRFRHVDGSLEGMKSMRIDDGVEMLEIEAMVMGRPRAVYPTLLWDRDTLILVDTGYPGQLPLLQAAVEKASFGFRSINLIILTHQDIDHIGNVRKIQQAAPDEVDVLAYPEEIPYIQGDQRPVKLAQLEKQQAFLPDEMKAVYEQLNAAFQTCFTKVDRALRDREELPYCGGIQVIHTPGHTPGHICLFLKQHKTLIAGDLLGVEGGRLVTFDQSLHDEPKRISQSLKKLTQYDIQTVICYHGGIYMDEVNKRIQALTDE